MKLSLYSLFICVFINAAGCSKYPEGRIVVRNDSNNIISNANILVCGQTLIFNHIAPHSKQSGTFKVTSDSSYDIKVVLSNGQVLQSKLGYVTNGIKYDDVIFIRDDHISIKSAPTLSY